MRLMVTLVILTLFIFTSSFSQNTDELISQLKKEYKKIDQYRDKDPNFDTKTYPLAKIKKNIYSIKKQLSSVKTQLSDPLYFDHNIKLDRNINLIDFYVYPYTDDSFQIFARVKNSKKVYLNFVKLRFNLFSNGTFVDTDFTYIDFESCGSSGISPYRYSFINSFIDKTEFDSISYQIDYDIYDSKDDILWDDILKLETVTIEPSYGSHDWKGIVKNETGYSVSFPRIYACVFKDNKMVAMESAYLDVPNHSLESNSSGVFDYHIDLPETYDEIKYHLTYSLETLKGEGNLTPNIPIFIKNTYDGISRVPETFEIFVLDHENDPVDLLVDFDDGADVQWHNDFASGRNAKIEHSFVEGGAFNIRAKAKDLNGIETTWSNPVAIDIMETTEPVIITEQLESANYDKNYYLQLEADGGIEPYSWRLNEGNLPDGVDLNEQTGVISGKPKQSGLFDFSIILSDNGYPALSDTVSFILEVHNHRPEITSADTIKATIDSDITYFAKAEDPDGNEISYQFIHYPPWLQKTSTTLYGTTPHKNVDTSFVLIASDGDLADTLTVSLLVQARPLDIINKEIQPAVYKVFYADTLMATGGITPYTWSLLNGSIPSGLELNEKGIISGIPTVSDQFQFTARVRDSGKPAKTDSVYIPIMVENNKPVITSPDSISIKTGHNFNYIASANDPDGNNVDYIIGRSPSWITITDSIISGVAPHAPQDTSFVLRVTDGELSDSLTVHISIRYPTLVDSDKSLPLAFNLFNTYPNPFNPVTSIKFSLPKRMQIKLLVYDINGRWIDQIYSGTLGSGIHTFKWDASGFSSGIYFIKLLSAEYIETRKCTLLK